MSDIVNRLRCRYPCGPFINGEPEFGWRDMSGPITTTLPTALMIEAATTIESLRDDFAAERKALLSLFDEKDKLIADLSDRVAAQAELLAKRAEGAK